MDPDGLGLDPALSTSVVLGAEHFARVIRDGVLRAEFSVALATADLKALLVPDERRRARSILAHLRKLARRGIEVRLLHAGVPSRAALDELREELPEGFVVRRCPRVHTKVVIVDAQAMYLGSANLTGAGLGAKAGTRRNFEAGIWTEDPALIEPLLSWFDEVWEGRECEDCGRREHCPVPLEEPELG